MSAIGPGSGETTWKYGAGSTSPPPSSSPSPAAAPWHFGQCRLRQLLYAMTVCAQPSQRATCPPSAAVRQRSIALMTFSWSRLTWPALAQRHAAPWSRKISATSSAGRDTVGGGFAGGCFFLILSWVSLGFLALWPCQPVERTLDGGDRAGRDVEIARRGLQFLVTQEHLDLPDIGAAIEQMGGEAVAQRMHRHGFPDPRRVGRFVE